MTIQATKKHTAVLPMGEYRARLVSIDIPDFEAQHGPVWRWTFLITEGDFADTELSALSSQTYSDYPSKAYSWARALGHPKDADFNSDLIVEKPCRLKVNLNETQEAGKEMTRKNEILAVLPPVKVQTEDEELFGAAA